MTVVDHCYVYVPALNKIEILRREDGPKTVPVGSLYLDSNVDYATIDEVALSICSFLDLRFYAQRQKP